jgi:creatinine amidohydrolase
LAGNGFKKFIVINGHKGANNPALITACKSIHQFDLPDILISLVDPLYIGKGIADIKDAVEHHAGELEISHVWYKHPHLIKADKLPDKPVDMKSILSPFSHNDLFFGSGDSIEIFWNSKEQKAFTPSGSFSDSSKSSPEKGQKYHDYMVQNLVKFIDWLRQYKGPVGNS